jgi:hypothetical protein
MCGGRSYGLVEAFEKGGLGRMLSVGGRSVFNQNAELFSETVEFMKPSARLA